MDSREIIQNEVGSSEEISELEARKDIKVDDEVETKPYTSEFSIKTRKEDFTLIVENSQLFVNRSVLSLVSPVFEEMLNTNSLGKGLDELDLQGKKYGDVCEFIRCIHPGKMKKVSRENVDQVFPLACEYKAEHLMEACAEVFMSSLIPTPPAAEIAIVLVKANQYGLESLKECCMKLLRNKPLEELDKAERQLDKEVPFEVKNMLQELTIEKLRSELGKTRQRLQASLVLSNIIGRFSLDGTRLLVHQNSDDAVGWCKKFKLSIPETLSLPEDFFWGGQLISLKAQFNSYDLQVSVEKEKKNTELSIHLENVSNLCTGATFVITFVVKNWMRGKQDHVVNWTTTINSRSPKHSQSVGTLEQLRKETNGFIYKGKIECEIYILQT